MSQPRERSAGNGDNIERQAPSPGAGAIDPEVLQRLIERNTYLGRFDATKDLEYGFSLVDELRGRYDQPGRMGVIVNRVSRDPDTLEVGVFGNYLGIWVDTEFKDMTDGRG